jgi:DNA-binding transcriptional ArsR family regulator
MQTATQETTPEQQPVIDPRKMARAAQRASELMKTLGHKDRLMVLCHLTSGEKSVGELARLLDIPQSPLSQHLARMRKENLVTTRREAQTIYYSIASGEATDRSHEFGRSLLCISKFVH